jgi:hypothetical protein
LILYSTVYSSIDLKGIGDQLPSNFMAELSTETMKKFKYNFHSASFHLMTGVVTAMRTLAGHLVNVISEEEDHEILLLKTVKDFIFDLYKDSSKEFSELLHEIGLRVPDPNPDNILCLAELPLTATYSCLKLFIHWVDEGFYDFNTLPFVFKATLDSEDVMALEQLQGKWSGTPADLMKVLEEFTDILHHSEQHIIQADETVSIIV